MEHSTCAGEIKRELALACASEAAVLITGETGTGKSTLAEFIHAQGRRAARPFITVNLASLHEATIESTLFGHERGAFTGADRMRVGRFEMADTGTLFLDELGELSLPLQARLLEFLQRKSITPLGSTRERKLDVRVICATNRDLEREVRQGRFREDLYHRIRVLNLELPSLAEMDGALFSKAVHTALETACARSGVQVYRLTKEVAELLECYDWPGNFRELENVLEVSVLGTRNFELGLHDLPAWFVESSRAGSAYRLDSEVAIRVEEFGRKRLALANVPIEGGYRKTLRKFECAVLRHFIGRHSGNLARAAHAAGLSRATFYRKAEMHGLLEG